MDRLKDATKDIPWAFGPPIANAYRGSFIASGLKIAVPDGYDLHVKGISVEKLNPKAFESVEHINNNDDYPVLSYVDTVLVLLRNYDTETAYHMIRNDGHHMDCLMERALDEDNADIYKNLFVVLQNMERFRPYASKIECFVDKFTRERAEGLSEKDFKKSMRDSYDIPPFDIDIEVFINKVLENADESEQ